MTRARHLSTASLLALARRPPQRLPVGETSHLGQCARCREEVRVLGTLADYLREPAPDPPPGVVARAWALMEPRPPRLEERARYRIARLVFDSRDARAAAGVRAPIATRHQLWRAAGVDIDVRLEGSGLGVEAALMGQVLPRRREVSQPAHGTVWLLESGCRPRWSLLGPSGDFTLPAPRGRRWALWLEWDGLRLRLESP